MKKRGYLLSPSSVRDVIYANICPFVLAAQTFFSYCTLDLNTKDPVLWHFLQVPAAIPTLDHDKS